MTADTPLRRQAVGMLLVTVGMWSVGPLFIRYFTEFYNVWTQNAFRYGCAALVLLAWAAVRRPGHAPLTRDQWRRLAFVAVANVAMQTLFALTYYFIYPSVASLVARVNILIATGLSFAIFHDERRVIRSPRFIGGVALALPGVVAVIWGQDPEVLARLRVSDRDFVIGVLCAVGYATLGAAYTLTIKHAVRSIAPLRSFTHVSWMTALLLAVPMLVSGGAADLVRGPALPLGLMAMSAVLFIAIAHTTYYMALREIKVVVSASLLQLIPVLTCLSSALVYGDHLSPAQMAGGVAVIGGAWLAALAQARRAQEIKAPVLRP